MNNAVKQNVMMTTQLLKKTSAIIDTFVAERKVNINGGVYNLSNGHIDMVA